MKLWRSAPRERMLPARRLSGPMPAVIAVMMLLMVLAAAAGLGLHRAAGSLGAGLDTRVTVQVVDADREARDAAAHAAEAALAEAPGVVSVRRVSDADLGRLLAPWLGGAGIEQDLPLPAMIDAELSPGADRSALRTTLQRAAPRAELDEHGAALAPLSALIGALQWLALLLVLLVAGAAAFVVTLAARAALDQHRATIEVMHLMGATDRQVARLFQRRLARDALMGGAIGFALAAAVVALVSAQVARLGSELIGATALGIGGWLALAALPLLGTLLAMLAARWTVLGALRRML